MKINEVMTKECRYLDRSAPFAEAAQLMAQADLGAVPIASEDRLVGMLTDRDIVTRGVAQSRDAVQTKVGELMSDKVYYCYDDDECDKVAANMGELQVRRMPVVNRDKRLVGAVSLGDLSANGAKKPAGEALSEISQSG